MSLLENKNDNGGPHPRRTPDIDMPVSAANIESVFTDCSDFVSREIYLGGKKELKFKMCYIDGTVGGIQISEEILKPAAQNQAFRAPLSMEEILDLMLHGGIYNFDAKRRDTMDDVCGDLVTGSCVIVFDEIGAAASFEAKTPDKRGVSEPSDESVLKGSKDAFVENIRTNTALIRRRIKTPHLKLKHVVVGRQTMTNVTIVYIDGITNPELPNEIERRLKSIDVDGLLSLKVIEENIRDNKRTMFPQFIFTERPDKLCSNVVAGRAGLLVDGIPVAYILPCTFPQFLRMPEDNAYDYIRGSFTIMLRYLCAVINMILPAAYVAVVNFHQEMLPTSLAEGIIHSKSVVPFNTFIEVVAMLVAFQILLEAGVRLPKTVGHAVSIVGGLIIGQAAVEAKLASPAVVILVAFTSVTSFVFSGSDMGGAFRAWRAIMLIAAAFTGLFGVFICCLALLYHLSDIESFGVAYLSPFAANDYKNVLSAGLLRLPLKFVKFRQDDLKTPNRRNQR